MDAGERLVGVLPKRVSLERFVPLDKDHLRAKEEIPRYQAKFRSPFDKLRVNGILLDAHNTSIAMLLAIAPNRVAAIPEFP